MTVIAWDGHTLAVDGMSTYGLTISYVEKLWMYDGGAERYFATGYGAYSGIVGLMDWYSKGAIVSKYPYADEMVQEAGLVVLSGNGELVEYSLSPYPMECPKSPLVWGCGGDIALGAMSQGVNAIEAVKAACIHNAACGGDISYATADSSEVQVLVNTTVNSWGEL